MNKPAVGEPEQRQFKVVFFKGLKDTIFTQSGREFGKREGIKPEEFDLPYGRRVLPLPDCCQS
jgi:hypothetical protein